MGVITIYFRKRRKKRLILKILILFFSLVCSVIILDTALRPIVLDLALHRAKIIVNSQVNKIVYDSLAEMELGYNDIVYLNYNSENVVSSLETNTVAVNTLKTKIVSDLQTGLDNNSRFTVSVPSGNLTGLTFLNNRGPKIKVDFNVSEVAATGLESNFSSAGINQTKHEIILRVSTTIFVYMGLYRSNTVYDIDFLIAETIIVGSVPSTFANIDIG